MLKPILVMQGVSKQNPNVLNVLLDTHNSADRLRRYVTKVALVQNGEEVFSNLYDYVERKVEFNWYDFLCYSSREPHNTQARMEFFLSDLKDKVSTAEIVVTVTGPKGRIIIKPIRVPVNPYFIKEKKEEGV